MTNPDNIIRLHSRAGGRGSVYEANAPYQVYSTGMFSGTGTSPNTSPDMNIIVGGGDKPASPTNPHIVVGENPQGYKVMLDIVGTTILQATAPATNKRYTAVVVYANDLSESSTDATTTGSPSQNGVILVNGPAAASPRMPNDSEIRAAITDDGGTGTQSVYAIIAAPVISSTTTTITDTNRQHSYLNSESIKEPKSLDYVVKIGSGEYGEGEILSIPANQLDVNANYLVIASACTNYNGASGDFIMNVRGSDDANFISATQSVNGWMATLTSAGVSKPSSSKGFTMALSMNGHKTQGTNPPRLVAVRLTY